jgi:hypothetical protein
MDRQQGVNVICDKIIIFFLLTAFVMSVDSSSAVHVISADGDLFDVGFTLYMTKQVTFISQFHVILGELNPPRRSAHAPGPGINYV